MRYQLSETVYCLGKFATGKVVTIALYNLATGAAVALSSSACPEIGTTGVYRWASSNLAAQPVAYAEYLYVMTDGVETQEGKIVLGGFVERIDAAVSSRLAISGYTAPDNAAIEKARIDAAKARKALTNRAVISGDRRTVTIYDDDGATPLFQFDVSADKLSRTPA
jgi:hypothetical protein